MNEFIILLLIAGAAYSIHAMHHQVLIPDISTKKLLPPDTYINHNGICYAAPQITSVTQSRWVTGEVIPTMLNITYRIREKGISDKYHYTYQGGW